MLQVTAGSALGVVSMGSDSMAITGGGYSGLQLMPGQQAAAAEGQPGYQRTTTSGAAALPAAAKLLAALLGALALLLI